MGHGIKFHFGDFCPVFHQIYERKVRRIQHLQLSLVSLSSSKSKKHACIIIYICTVYLQYSLYCFYMERLLICPLKKYKIYKFQICTLSKSTSQTWPERCNWSNGRFMMPYLQVPYLRVPLLLQFFNDRKRFTALSSPQLQVPRDFRCCGSGCVEWHKQKNRTVVFAICLRKNVSSDIGSLGAVWSVSMKGATIIYLTKH